MRNMILMNRIIKLIAICTITLLVGVQDMSATHIIGGSLRYRHIGGDDYEISLVFRRDCFTGAADADFDDPARVFIYRQNGAVAPVGEGNIGRLNLNFNPDDTLGNTFISDCGFEGTQVCVQQTEYKDTISLPFISGGYILAYQRCCRNPTIQNILEPLNTGGTWWTSISEEALMTNNSSPQFGEWPGVYICADEPIEFDHSATDLDGDSLVYRLYAPFSGGDTLSSIPGQAAAKPPYDQVSWAMGYGLDNVLGSTSPLSIDPQTGIITGTPDFVGQFLVGVAVDEYRDGELLGTTRRDFQYNVRVCSDPPTAMFIANDGNCDGTVVTFENTSVGAANYLWQFDFPSTDPALTSTEQNPIFEYAEPGVYKVKLTATRFSDDCRSEVILDVAALTSDIEVSYDLNIQSCNADGGYTIQLTNTSFEPQAGFEVEGQNWTIVQGGQLFEFDTETVTLDVLNEDFTIELQAISNTGCNKAILDSIDIDEFVAVTDFTVMLEECPEGGGATITLTDISDSLNPFDSPDGSAWTIETAAGTITSTASPITLDVEADEVIVVTLDTDFGGGCEAIITRDVMLTDLVPQAGYTVEGLGCPDDGTVDVLFTSTSAADNPDYELLSTSWDITVAGSMSTGTDTSITVNVPKDSIVTVTLISTFDNGCRDTLIENIVPGPFATIEYTRGNPFKICIGDTVQLVDEPNSDFTYTWSPLEGLVFADPSDTSNPSLVGLVNTTYFVTVSDGLCTVSDSVMVEVLDDDNLMIVGDSITCDGSVELTASGGILDGDFVWSTDPSFSDTIFVGETLVTSFDGTSQTYYVAFTGINCDDPFAEYTVSLSDVFAVQFNGSPVRACIGDTVQILSNYDPLLTYVWTPETGLIFPDGPGNAFFVGDTDTEYAVSLSDDFCSLDTSIAVQISNTQELQILGDSVICDENILLVASGALGNGDYEWATDPDFNNIVAVGDTLDTVLDGLTETFYLRYTDATCGDETFSYTVRLYEFDLIYVDTWVICPGDSVNFPLFNQGEQDLTYAWTSDVHIVSDTFEMSPIIGTSVDETDPFTLYFTATSIFGCSFSDSVLVTFTQNPAVNIAAELQDCGEFTVCFTIDGEFEGLPSWDFGDPTTATDISLEETPCYTYAAPGVYDVVLTNVIGICAFAPDTLSVTVNDEITIDAIAEQIACLGDSVTVTASSPDNNVSFTWCTTDGDTLVVGADVTVIADSSYQIIVKATDVNGCSSESVVDITVVEFDIDSNIGEVLCDGQETFVELTVNGTTEGYSFDWGDNDCIVSGGTTANPIIVATGAKTFGVTITDDATGCTTTEEFPITTTSFEIDAEAAPDTTINPGEFVEIFVVDQFDDYTYEWSNGSTDGEQEVSPEESTTYTVTVTDELGCTATAAVSIRVREPVCDESDVYIPNAFTPNGDNVNDILYVRSNFIDELLLVVYNRWGEEVFRTTDPAAGWDGTLNGDRLAPDAYAYYMDVLCINGVRYSKKGNVSLLK